ncbi:Helix-turn-helix domain-containing protein [Jatrophihabitans endophyticus]|uniref:Helix-turn-helix domain-containing protein n=1 Tax=Jatrophihabitans endophyticus TaxID=1206085 RepID=A0A1M5IXW8_9ACTN|nr:helix-turn-helix domain-containing protein [Jatrophihabitans endophyticus]SHG32603.1 Helix-turn-helix domain-containing protein [Jatrophihabitans endophyticus]
MGDFVVDAEVLARARFGTSRLTETVAALKILRGPQCRPWHRAWRDRHRDAFRRRLAADPQARALVGHGFGPTWTADFLTVPPAAPDLSLDEELHHLESLSDEQIRRDLLAVRGPLPPEVGGSGLASCAAGLLRWVWSETVAADWPRRRRVLQADIVARTARLATLGWSGALADIGPGVRWLGDNRLQVNQRWYPTRDIRGADLIFLAAHAPGGWVSWRLPDRYGVVYPVTGVFAADPSPRPGPLGRLLGDNRAQILLRCREPISTSALAAVTGQPLGGVGNHLRVLLDAGLLHRRRAGRQVLYWCSEVGRDLVASSGAADHGIGNAAP